MCTNCINRLEYALEFKAIILDSNRKYKCYLKSFNDPLSFQSSIIQTEPEEETTIIKKDESPIGIRNLKEKNENNSKLRKRFKLKPTPDAVWGKETEWKCSYCENYFACKFDMLLHRRRMHQKE